MILFPILISSIQFIYFRKWWKYIHIYFTCKEKIYMYIYNENNIQYILEIQWLKERKKNNSKIEKKKIG